jgi:triosephosphate isomerase
MNRRYRKTVIAGNWKMNKTPAEAKALINEIKETIGKVKWCDVIVCVPFVDIPVAVKATKGAKISVGAQNIHFEPKGAYTGEISADMLKELGVKYVIVGHSERRTYHGETNETVNAKLHASIDGGLTPIVCVGETQAQRDMGISKDIIRAQVKTAFYKIPADRARKIIIAYEPVWAIGTGLTATPAEAQEICSEIRAVIRSLYDARIARAVTILYGGSMNPANAAELLAQPDIDGGLIGGASLKAETFVPICVL